MLMKRILITTGNGMFGKALASELTGKDPISIREWVSQNKEFFLKVMFPMFIFKLMR